MVADGIAAGDGFGSEVAIEGDTLIIGAWKANSEAGAAYIFTRSGSTWTQEAKVIGTNATAANDYFGIERSIDISGNTVVIGAYGDDYISESQTDAGAAYIFTVS
jgi:hypothetical protein